MNLSFGSRTFFYPLVVLSLAALLSCKQGDETTGSESTSRDSGDGLTGESLYIPSFHKSISVSQGSGPIMLDFEITNVGDSPVDLTIKNISCSCISATLDTETIPSGDFATVSLVFEPTFTNRSQMVEVRIETSDPSAPLLVFTARYDLVFPLEILPSVMDIGRVARFSEQTFYIRLRSTVGNPSEAQISFGNNSGIKAVKVEELSAFEARALVSLRTDVPGARHGNIEFALSGERSTLEVHFSVTE